MNYLRKIVLFIFLFLPIQGAFAQFWEVGGSTGGSGYIGDLNPNKLISFSGVGVSGMIKYNIDSRLGFKVSYLSTFVEASDKQSFNDFQKIRNLSFTSAINEISMTFDFNYFKYIPSVSYVKFVPYTFVGLGIFNFNPKTTYQGRKYDLVFLGTEGQDEDSYYKTYAFSFIYGMGFKYNFFKAMSLMLEIGYRTTTTDFLDDVSGLYPEPDKLNSDLARALSDRSGEYNGFSTGVPNTQRGDMRGRDHYYFFSIGITVAIITQSCFLE